MKVTKVKVYSQPPRYVQVPCNKCIECFHRKRSEWWFRVEQENKYNMQPYRWFLTLTYSESKVPRKRGTKTLLKRHPQLFFKRLRKAGYKVKYILVGEYGSQTQRPHYHVIMWTDAPTKEIDRCWHYGHVHYRQIAKETVFYTLKYILNPRQGDNEVKQKEYAVFSQGIGLQYLTEAMYDYHTVDFENPKFNANIAGEEVPLPRYYRMKIFTSYQIKIHAYKQSILAVRKTFDEYRQLKKQGFKGNKKKELHARKLRKAKFRKEKFNKNEKL